MLELREENLLLRTQLASAQSIISSDKQPADGVDKNANLQTMHAADEPIASDSNEPAEQQVEIWFLLLECSALFIWFKALLSMQL